MKQIIYIIAILGLIPLASALNMTSSNFKMFVDHPQGVANSTGPNFKMIHALGSSVGEKMTSQSFNLSLNIIAPAGFVDFPAEGPAQLVASGGGGGGGPDAGCAWGFYKDEYGRCISLNLTESDVLGKEITEIESRINSALNFLVTAGSRIYPKSALIGFGVLSLSLAGILIIRRRHLEEKEEQKEMKKEDESA